MKKAKPNTEPRYYVVDGFRVALNTRAQVAKNQLVIADTRRQIEESHAKQLKEQHALLAMVLETVLLFV
jgi:hypothetical protein